MSVGSFITLAAGLTNISLGILVANRGRNNKVNLTFALFSFLTGVWALTNFYLFLSPSIHALNTTYATGALVIPSLILWSNYLLDTKIRAIILWPILIAGILLFILSLTPGFILESFEINQDGSQSIFFASSFYIFVTLVGLMMLYFLIRLTRGYIKAEKELRSRIFFVGLGLAITIAVVAVGFLVLPFFGINLVSPLDAQSSLILVAFSAYAIIKHKFLDIRLIATQLLTYLLLLILLGRVFFSVSGTELLLNIVIFILGLVLGILLVRSVINEVRRREETQQINESLRALRDITRKITESLDFSEVTQDLVDEVTKRFDYKGALVVSIKDDKKTVKAVTVSNVPNLKSAMQMLPKQFTEIEGTLNDDSYVTEIIKSGETRNGSNLSDFISPAVDPVLAKALQAKAGIKSVVGVPISSENVTRGALLIGIAKEAKDVLPREIATMKSLGDQLGIVTRNIEIIQELKRLDRAKSDFIDIASHQLRTPISATKGYISMILGGDFGKVPTSVKDSLSKVYSANNRLINLINDLLNVSRIEKGRMLYNLIPVDMVQIAKEVVEVIEPQAKQKNLKVNVTLPTKVPKILADTEKFRQLVMNITDNAVKYTKEGHIDIELKEDKKAKTLIYSVKDTGVGISKDDLDRLFARFSRGTNVNVLNTQGTGLGLYLAKQIAKAHHGQVWAESEGRGKGSQFYLEVPYQRNGK